MVANRNAFSFWLLIFLLLIFTAVGTLWASSANQNKVVDSSKSDKLISIKTSVEFNLKYLNKQDLYPSEISLERKSNPDGTELPDEELFIKLRNPIEIGSKKTVFENLLPGIYQICLHYSNGDYGGGNISVDSTYFDSKSGSVTSKSFEFMENQILVPRGFHVNIDLLFYYRFDPDRRRPGCYFIKKQENALPDEKKSHYLIRVHRKSNHRQKKKVPCTFNMHFQ